MAQVLCRVLCELGKHPRGCCLQGPGAGSPQDPDPVRKDSPISVQEEPGYGPQGPPLLLLGPSRSGKSGLLFMAAVLAAEEGAGPVIFLSRDPLQKVPGTGRTARDPLTLKQIRFLYPATPEELLRQLSSLHLASPSPSFLLLDGLERYLPPCSGPAEGAHISALLLDAASHLRCGLVVSAVPPADGTEGPFMAVERYFPTRCQLYPEMTTDVEETAAAYNIAFSNYLPEWILHVQEDGKLKIFPIKAQRPADT
uniref:SWIM-type zinc finger 7 associated protein 1 n=1 Tax=Leptobrachium leishanense TaxID=445787 RepID=A0A8C5QBN3_9ANUR